MLLLVLYAIKLDNISSRAKLSLQKGKNRLWRRLLRLIAVLIIYQFRWKGYQKKYNLMSYNCFYRNSQKSNLAVNSATVFAMYLRNALSYKNFFCHYLIQFLKSFKLGQKFSWFFAMRWFSSKISTIIKALVRSKILTELALNFCKTLRSRSRSKRFERRS